MSFHVCYYHVIWTTKNRAPWSGTNVERHLIESISEKSQKLKSPIECINTCVNHVHVAV
jgi:REP element-mobilizing transposase RayT